MKKYHSPRTDYFLDYWNLLVGLLGGISDEESNKRPFDEVIDCFLTNGGKITISIDPKKTTRTFGGE